MEEVVKRFMVDSVRGLHQVRYNIAPLQPITIVFQESAKRILETVSWGLVPSWADNPSRAGTCINARSETLSEKPVFRGGFRSKRCLIPATGFYEWRKEGKSKQPYYFQLKSGEPFAMAGIWEDWHSPEGSQIVSAAVVTVWANRLVNQVHHRMPAILGFFDEDKWLDHSAFKPEALQSLLKPYAAEEMESFPVSTKVNSAANEGEELIRKIVPLPTFEQGSLF